MNRKSGKIKKAAAMVLLCGSLVLQTVPAPAALPAAADSLTSLAGSFETDLSSLLGDASLLPAGDSVSDWLAFLAGRMGEQELGASYLTRLEEYVTEQYAEQDCLDPVTATSWHRLIMAVTVLGGDPTAFGKDAEGNPVNLVADGCYRFYAADSFDAQGLNAWLYALIALDSYCFEVPADAKYTRERILAKLVESQEEDGGFGLVPGGSDVDITAMVLQALAPYQNNTVTYPDRGSFLVTIREVTEKALDYLSAQQQSDGGFLSYDTPNSESCSQVIIALCSLGIDPEQDERFVKEGGSVTDALEGFLQDDGTYSHDASGSGSDAMATQQAAFASYALEQFRNGQRRLFDLQREPLEAAPAFEIKLEAMSDEEILASAEDLRAEYETIAPEDRSYVTSFDRVKQALEEKGEVFDEETSLYYNLNKNVPVTAVTDMQAGSEKKAGSSAAMIAGIAAAVLVLGGGSGILLKKKKDQNGSKQEKKKQENKVHW